MPGALLILSERFVLHKKEDMSLRHILNVIYLLMVTVLADTPVFRNEVTQIGVQGFIPIASSSFVTSSSYSVRSMTDIFFPLYGFTYSILYRLSARNFAR